MIPYLMALNLNGMDNGGDRVGRKILPLGQGERDLSLCGSSATAAIAGRSASWATPRTTPRPGSRDNLDGVDWLLPQLDGNRRDRLRSPARRSPPRPASKAELPAERGDEWPRWSPRRERRVILGAEPRCFWTLDSVAARATRWAPKGASSARS